jgi:UDP-glucose 4-epimerase
MEFVRLMVDNDEQGIFWPQNTEYSNTTELVKQIACAHGKKMLLLPGCVWALKLLSHATGLVNKAFGSLCYEQSLSEYREKYCLTSLPESILKTENKA